MIDACTCNMHNINATYALSLKCGSVTHMRMHEQEDSKWMAETFRHCKNYALSKIYLNNQHWDKFLKNAYMYNNIGLTCKVQNYKKHYNKKNVNHTTYIKM